MKHSVSTLIVIIIVTTLFSSCELYKQKEKKEKMFPPAIPCPGIESVEYHGETYPTIQIGSQCWLAKNLNIGVQVDGNMEMKDNGELEKYCYNNDSLNCEIYGGLYQWDEVMQYTNKEGARGICPEGWHIPTNLEVEELSLFVEGNSKYLKIWNYLSYYCNQTGFSAFPAGHMDYDKKQFIGMALSCHFWVSKKNDISEALGFSFEFNEIFYNDFTNCHNGFSVRCIKDE